MIFKKSTGKGALSKLLEKAVEIFLKKECNKINNIEINIIASTSQIIKGIINKINIVAEEINYRDLLFDEIELEANQIRMIFKIKNKELKITNNSKLKLKISLSANSIKSILLSSKWNSLGDMISKKILNLDNLEDVEIKNDQLFFKGLNKTNSNKNDYNYYQKISIKAKEGKIYLKNNANNKKIQIPIEDKVYISYISIKNNIIVINANSSISFN